MRHRNAGKHLNRTAAHRKAMRRNLAASLFEHGAIRTTTVKAKDARRFVERLITIAREGTLHARRRVIAMLGDRNMIDKENPEDLADQTIVQRLFDDIAPRYADRPGGYTRLIRLPERRIGDGGGQVLLQLVEQTTAAPAGEPGAVTARRRKRAARRAEAAKAAEAKIAPAAEAEQAPIDESRPAEDADQDPQARQGETGAGPTDPAGTEK